jgi:hypothetical protein
MTDPDGDKNLHNWAGDVWIKPLSDGSFAAALINRDPLHAHPLRVGFGRGDTMLFPAGPFANMLVRDVHARADLGVYSMQVEVEVSCVNAGVRCRRESSAALFPCLIGTAGATPRREDSEADASCRIGLCCTRPPVALRARLWTALHVGRHESDHLPILFYPCKCKLFVLMEAHLLVKHGFHVRHSKNMAETQAFVF